ncbi:hypothetical protein Tco_0867836, partial [Tanacetum coccineum]
MPATHQNSRILQKYQQRQGNQVSFGAIITMRSFAQESYVISTYNENDDEILKLELRQAPVCCMISSSYKVNKSAWLADIRIFCRQRQGRLRIHQQHQTAMVLAATMCNGISNAIVARQEVMDLVAKSGKFDPTFVGFT